MGLTWIGSCGFFFYLGNLYHQEQVNFHNITFLENNKKICPSCSSLCCLPNICSCILFPFKLCMGLTWIGSCGFFFYLGNLYHQEQVNFHNITFLEDNKI